MAESAFERVLRLARADDPAAVEALARFSEPELAGELMVACWRAGTAAGRAAVLPLLERPFRRGAWQGFKRVYKLAEAAGDAEAFGLAAFVLDRRRGATWPVSERTHGYMRRRTYRHLKRVARERPEALLDHLEALLPRYGPRDPSELLRRVLRLGAAPPPADAGDRFAARLENPFAADADDADPDAATEALLALSAEELVRPAPAPTRVDDGAPGRPPRWRGPIFAELWVRDPERLCRLLERTRHEEAARELVRLLRERVGEGLHAVDLERVYALLAHPVGAAWRFALSVLAARARRELLRFDELVDLLDRAREGPDWDVAADLLFVLDDERAEATWPALGPPLRELLVAHPDAPGVGPVVAFLRRRCPDRLGPPLFDWAQAVALVAAARPDVRELGRDVARALGGAAPLEPDVRRRLLATSLPDEDPELVHALLTDPGAVPGGHRPPEGWPTADLRATLAGLPGPGFAAVRRALLHFEEAAGGLDPAVARELVGDDAARTRRLGLELLDAALRRGAASLLDVADLLAAGREDVVVWAREALERAAAAGGLPNEALYRMLDAAGRDVRGFGRKLVREHLERFEAAELIVFCAESPDAATADLGIGLYESRAAELGLDLRDLVPMFRVLLFKVAQARREKDRLLQTLERWALAAEDQARLVVDVVGAFRRSAARLDHDRAVRLLVRIAVRYPDLELPFDVSPVFGHTLAAPSEPRA